MSRATSFSPKSTRFLQGARLRATLAVFGALGDATRLKLVVSLCAGGALSIAQLTAGTDLTRQAVSKHLRVLAEAGLVRDVKAGRERLWEFAPDPLEEAVVSLQAIARQWDHALQRLKAKVEGETVR
jgi:DNA-binding transcriptional ArsR family regulator